MIKSDCIVLFATHFHELTIIESKFENVQNLSVNALVEENESITMLYEIGNGPCEKSFGIEVARVVKFPEQIINDALQISNDLEQRSRNKDKQDTESGCVDSI